jgi:hypothetical protein
MQERRRLVIDFVVVLLFLSTILSAFFTKYNATGSDKETAIHGQMTPLNVNWSVAVVSSDEDFLSGVRSAIVARELRVLPATRAWEAVGYDLVIIGWDALEEVSKDPKLVLAFLNGSRVLAVAEPGKDALRILFSSLVKPVEPGEGKKAEPSDPFAFLPWVDDPSLQSTVMVRAIPTYGGRLAMEYIVASLKSKSDLPKAIIAVTKKALENDSRSGQG